MARAAPADLRDHVTYGVSTRSSKRPAIHVYFEYICWKFAGLLLDRVNTLLACHSTVLATAVELPRAVTRPREMTRVGRTCGQGNECMWGFCLLVVGCRE